MKVTVTAFATARFETSLGYLRSESLRAAERVRASVDAAIDSLASMPARGRLGPIPGTRELVVRGTPFVIVYEVTADAVTILRIRHTSQDPSP